MVKNFILSSNIPFIKCLRESIKCIEIEETMDLLFHRPLGLLIAKIAVKIGLTPMLISLLSLFSGIASGILYYWQNNIVLSVIAAVFLTLSAIFDSADGQVARLTNTTSELGKIIDGIIDTAVFLFVYIPACLYFYPKYGPWIFLFGAVSGFAQSLHSLIYDFYKNEVSFLYGNFKQFRNPTIKEVKENLVNEKGFFMKIKNLLHLDYVQKQYLFTTRKGKIKALLEEISHDPEKRAQFKAKYKELCLPLMPYWALCGGTNVHRTAIMVFCLFAAFDYYLLFNLVVLSIPIVILVYLQNLQDRKLLQFLSSL